MGVLQLLIVDDELGIREGAKRALRNYEITFPYIEDEFTLEITTASSGEEAVDLFSKKKYDIVLLDNKLPGMEGVEVLEILSKKELDTLTIMITAFASIETAVAATKFGAYDFLTKPFTPQDLKTAVFKAAKHLLLQRITKDLTEEKKKIRFQFLSVLSHELKAPIAAITNYLKIMQQRIAGDDMSAYDNYVDRSLKRLDGMEKLIFDMLDLTRIESGEKKRFLQPLNIVEVATKSIEDFTEKAQEKGVTVNLDAPQELILNSDNTELEIILNNLISNAIKYNRDNGNVDVVLTEDDSQVIIKVKDTGFGMTPEEMDKLFKEFSRIKNKHTMQIPGSGIGLSTVKKIAMLYNGTAKAESTPDVGTTFIITLKKG